MWALAAQFTIAPVYYFDTAEKTEKARLDVQAAMWDPFTFASLQDVGIAEGWRCLEIGGGTGSVAAWLVEQVGESGHVVVTDLETRWLEPLAGPNLEVRRHDVVTDPLEESVFDLIHARLVLMYLPSPDAVLAKLVAALRPGGWLVVDEQDSRTVALAHPPHATWTKVCHAVMDVMRSAGADVTCGCWHASALARRGLADLSAETLVVQRPVPELADYLIPLVERARQAVLDAGYASAAELEEFIAAFDDESHLSTYSPIMVSARGRRI
jgi:ubiquinone/menaquinone biosynthesis C-methylase UbiE